MLASPLGFFLMALGPVLALLSLLALPALVDPRKSGTPLGPRVRHVLIYLILGVLAEAIGYLLVFGPP